MTEPTPLQSNFYRTLRRRAENGHELTINEIENVIEGDPAAKAACAEMAERIRAGEDMTVDELAQRLRVPVDFAAMIVIAFASNLVIGMKAETIN